MKRWIILGFCMCFAGCTGYQYLAPPHYVPVNTKKGNIVTNVSLNSFQVGYSMSNHFSAFVAGHYRKNHNRIPNIFVTENDGEFSKTDLHKQLDLGLTYFKAIDSKFNFEVVTWAGMGRIEYSNSQDLLKDYEFSFKAKKLSFNIQPNISIVFNENVDLSFFSNFNYSRYYNMYGSLDLGGKEDLEKNDRYFYNKRVVPLAFWEPGIQFRAGIKNFKLLFSHSQTLDLLNTGVKYRKNNFHIGISLNFNLSKSSE